MRILTALCIVFFGLISQANTPKVLGGPFDFNAPIVNDKTGLTTLSPSGQIVFENSTNAFYGLTPDGTWILFGATSGAYSQVTVDGSTSNGSSGNRVKVYTGVRINTGSDILYTSDSVNGDTFTINTDGLYSISYSASASLGDNFAISINASPTTLATSLPSANVLARCTIFGANAAVNCSWTGNLNATDIIRAHQDGTTSGNTGLNTFTITRINN